jgi:hypothetical protein
MEAENTFETPKNCLRPNSAKAKSRISINKPGNEEYYLLGCGAV